MVWVVPSYHEKIYQKKSSSDFKDTYVLVIDEDAFCLEQSDEEGDDEGNEDKRNEGGEGIRENRRK